MSHEAESATQESDRFLIFVLAGETYGVPLGSVREVMKVGEIKSVPYMKAHFRGVINLRGQITSVVDLRLRLGLKTEGGGPGLLLITDSGSWPLAALVDDVVAVAALTREEIDRRQLLQSAIPLSFFIGIGRHEGRLVNLIDVAGALTAEDYAVIARTKESA